MRIIIATVQVPFVRGGAEIHAEGLRAALCRAGHEAEIVAIPFKWYPPRRILDCMLACRLLDLRESSGNKIDRLIGLRFPAYFIPHPHKTLWILHQHRAAYDMWDNQLGDLVHAPEGAVVRAAIMAADTAIIPEAHAVYTNSGNVSARLKKYCGIDAAPLYHPPLNAEAFYTAPAEDYLFFPSRLWPVKRQALVLEALAKAREPVTVYFAGVADSSEYEFDLKNMAHALGVAQRVRWLGLVTEAEKIALYAKAIGIVYPPIDEDYGYVTLEAMLAGKPVITCSDSGGTLEFVRQRETGLVAEPTAGSLAQAMDELWQNRDQAAQWGIAARSCYQDCNITWHNVIEQLLI
jgi:glycosyltransferase involved in cell wall biosynthesis